MARARLWSWQTQSSCLSSAQTSHWKQCPVASRSQYSKGVVLSGEIEKGGYLKLALKHPTPAPATPGVLDTSRIGNTSRRIIFNFWLREQWGGGEEDQVITLKSKEMLYGTWRWIGLYRWHIEGFLPVLTSVYLFSSLQTFLIFRIRATWYPSQQPQEYLKCMLDGLCLKGELLDALEPSENVIKRKKGCIIAV